MLTAVTGINWGDEGKGRVIDLLYLDEERTQNRLHMILDSKNAVSSAASPLIRTSR